MVELEGIERATPSTITSYADGVGTYYPVLVVDGENIVLGDQGPRAFSDRDEALNYAVQAKETLMSNERS
jgi:hypothetical protein